MRISEDASDINTKTANARGIISKISIFARLLFLLLTYLSKHKISLIVKKKIFGYTHFTKILT